MDLGHELLAVLDGGVVGVALELGAVVLGPSPGRRRRNKEVAEMYANSPKWTQESSFWKWAIQTSWEEVNSLQVTFGGEWHFFGSLIHFKVWICALMF